MKNSIVIGNKSLNLEVKEQGVGQVSKLMLFVNGKSWYSINPFNFRADSAWYWKVIIQDLKDGSHLMFKTA